MLYCTQDNRQNIRIKGAFLTVSLYNNVGGIFIGAPKEQRGGDTANDTKGRLTPCLSLLRRLNRKYFILVDLRAWRESASANGGKVVNIGT